LGSEINKTIVSLISSTKTANELTVKCCLDKNTYDTGLKVGKEQFAKIKILSIKIQGSWNYTIFPEDDF
jgi:hypothetical protein